MGFDVLGLPVDQFDIRIGTRRFFDPRIEFRAVDQVADLIQLADIDKLPLHKLLVLVEEAFLLLAPDAPGLLERFFFLVRRDQSQLFVKLGLVMAVPANDLKRDFSKIPVHNKKFGVYV
jgi:hypothetical protein